MLAGVILGIIIIILLLILLPGFRTIGANEVGILTKRMLGKSMPSGQIIARNGEVGIQAKILMPGLYWRLPIIWSFSKVPVVNIDVESIGLVEAIDGEPLQKGRILGDEVECNQFQDAEMFLANHGRKGPQVGILRPGTYRINTKLFTITKADSIKITENTIGIAIARDGVPLPTGYIIAPRAKNADGTEVDHKYFQNGQMFLEGNGYRGPQLDTLQPGKYYINPLLFDIKVESVAEVLPGYVAVIRSNVGLELEKPDTGPRPSTSEGKLAGPIHEDVEKILIGDKYTRGIWREPIAPGKYNLNTIAFSPYQVPTSAITIDWATEGRIGTEIKGVKVTPDKQVIEKYIEDKESAVLYKFDPLKVTSKDGFQLEVNVRMVIRIQPANAAYIIARFGSVVNLIDQIVHPLIDSSFRNKAGEKKAIDFFQSRTDLQTEALAHAKEKFSEYNVEAQNLLIAYIDIPKDLLDTQTKKEIANQQQAQYDQEALAQEKRIAVMEKSSRADKQKDVIDAKLSIDINNDRAEAKAREADGDRRALILRAQGEKESTMLVADGNSYRSKQEGEGIASAYNAQKEAIGQQNVAIIKLMQEIAAGKIQIVPQILVAGDKSSGGNLFNAWLAQMMTQKTGKGKEEE